MRTRITLCLASLFVGVGLASAQVPTGYPAPTMTSANFAESRTAYSLAAPTDVVCTPSASGGTMADAVYHVQVVVQVITGASSDDDFVVSPASVETTCEITGGSGSGMLTIAWTNPSTSELPYVGATRHLFAIKGGSASTVGDDLYTFGTPANPQVVPNLSAAVAETFTIATYQTQYAFSLTGMSYYTGPFLLGTDNAMGDGLGMGSYLRGGGVMSVAIGDNLNPGSGRGNVAIGRWIGSASATGGDNVFVGRQVAQGLTTGVGNVGIGLAALSPLVSGASNIAVGSLALTALTTGGLNVGIGRSALSTLTTTSGNVGLGSLAGAFYTLGPPVATAPTNSIYLGAETRSGSATPTNELVIGNTVQGAGSNTGVIGNASTTDVYFGSATADAYVHAAKFYIGASTVGCSGTPTVSTYGIATTCTGPEASPEALLQRIQSLEQRLAVLEAFLLAHGKG